jgi:hypothetical protein
MSRASREAAARQRAAESNAEVQGRRERQRQSATIRVTATRGASDVDRRITGQPRTIRVQAERTDR